MRTNFIKAWLMPCLTMALLSMAFVGCEKPNEDTAPYITIAEESIILDATKGAQGTVTVDANCGWVATSNQPKWLTVATRQGNGKGTITIKTASANEETAAREATLTVTATDGSVKAEVTVRQMGTAASVELQGASDGKLTLSNEVDAKNGITVVSNVAWTGVQAEADTWYSVEVGDAVNGRQAVTFTVEEANETLEARTAVYTLNYVDGVENKSVELTLEQPACVPALATSVEAVNFATTAADEMTFTLTAAGPWTLTAPEWATVTPTEGKTGEYTVAVSVAANTTPAKKQGEIVITSTLDNKVVKTLPATQAGNEPEITAPAEVEAGCAAGVVEVAVTTNYAWTALSNDTWATIENASGEAGNATIKVNVTANTPNEDSKGAERTATIIVTCVHPDDNSLRVTKEIAIKQAEFDGYDLSEVETANCYITTQKNCTYKFNAAVRGNGKSDQELNIDVTPIQFEDGAIAMEYWRDNELEIISDIQLNAETGYISFKVNDGAPNGNVVIALATLDEFDPTLVTKVYWSWHIWVNSEDIEAKAMPITYPEFTVAPTVEVTMMDRNLGALINGKGATLGETQYGLGGVQDSYGMHYEWGRKDPFPGCEESFSPYRDSEYTSYLSSTRIKLYRTVDGKPLEVTSLFQGASLEGVYNEALNNGETPDEITTINYTIANPTVFVNGGGRGNVYADVTGVDSEGNPVTGGQNLPASWLYVPETLRNGSAYYNEWSWPTYLWGNSANGFTNYGVKTCYDPCPPGWRVPDANAFNFVIPSGWAEPLYADKETGEVRKAINCVGDVFWSKATDLGNSYVYTPVYAARDNQAYINGYSAGYEVYTGGYQSGETMFFPMSGQISYDSGNPCSDYSGWGSSASYALNSVNSYAQYISRMEIYAPSGNLTESWNWENETKVHNFPGAKGANNSSFHQACGYSVRCMKDVAPEIEAE
ncbi:MAG: BACON domain-containing protein [Rikenellaceae bacterium]|nr:BACON domain-containing protein [Rikenellaceae bacterium]